MLSISRTPLAAALLILAHARTAHAQCDNGFGFNNGNENCNGNSFSGGRLAGSVVAIVIACLILCCLLCMCFRRRRIIRNGGSPAFPYYGRAQPGYANNGTSSGWGFGGGGRAGGGKTAAMGAGAGSAMGMGATNQGGDPNYGGNPYGPNAQQQAYPQTENQTYDQNPGMTEAGYGTGPASSGPGYAGAGGVGAGGGVTSPPPAYGKDGLAQADNFQGVYAPPPGAPPQAHMADRA